MLLSKKRDFVREIEKDMEMCLWAVGDVFMGSKMIKF